MKKRAISTKQKILDTASRLFYQRGYQAVGVDLIAAEASIGKMTLYRHFPSKDDLIVAYLQSRMDRFWRFFEQSTQDASNAREQLLAFFTALQTDINKPTCYGCPFIGVISEYPVPSHVGYQVTVEHKQSVRTRFLQLASEAGAQQPEILADGLLLLIDGAYVAARMNTSSPSNPGVIHVFKAAQSFIDTQCKALEH